MKKNLARVRKTAEDPVLAAASSKLLIPVTAIDGRTLKNFFQYVWNNKRLTKYQKIEIGLKLDWVLRVMQIKIIPYLLASGFEVLSKANSPPDAFPRI